MCSCGIKHKIISEITGRVGKVIYGNKNKYPSLTLYYIFKNLALKHKILLNYQVIQKEIGKLLFYLDREISNETEAHLRQECYLYYGDDIEIVLYLNQLRRDYNKKFTDFISIINI